MNINANRNRQRYTDIFTQEKDSKWTYNRNHSYSYTCNTWHKSSNQENHCGERIILAIFDINTHIFSES